MDTSQDRNFSSVFDVQRPFRAKGLPGDTLNRNFSPVFDVQRPFRAKGLPGDTDGYFKIAIFPQFLTSNVNFVRKGCKVTPFFAIFHQFLTFNVHFVRQGCPGTP